MAEDRHGEADMTFWEHLDVLRASLLKMLAAMAVCSVVAFVCKDALFDFILAPGCSDFVTFRLLGRIGTWAGAGGMAPFTVKLINTDLAAQFVLHMKAAVFAGLLVASPYAIYLLFRFVSPALYEDERRYSVGITGGAYVMFLVGVLLNYFLIFPLTVRFLGMYQVSGAVENVITLQSYMDTLLMMSLTMGVVFEVPVLCWLLARAGFLTSGYMRRYRKHAVVVILVVAAVITPTSDVFTLLLVALPITLLYEVSILLVRATERKRQQTA